jgi:phage-related protein
VIRPVPVAPERPGRCHGPGVLEVVESHNGNAYRAVYTVRFEKAVYVLHAFQKKSPSRIRTAKRDVDLVAERLKTAERIAVTRRVERQKRTGHLWHETCLRS